MDCKSPSPSGDNGANHFVSTGAAGGEIDGDRRTRSGEMLGNGRTNPFGSASDDWDLTSEFHSHLVVDSLPPVGAWIASIAVAVIAEPPPLAERS